MQMLTTVTLEKVSYYNTIVFNEIITNLISNCLLLQEQHRLAFILLKIFFVVFCFVFLFFFHNTGLNIVVLK